MNFVGSNRYGEFCPIEFRQSITGQEYGRAAIRLVCAAGAIVLLIALVLASAPRDAASGELAAIAVPP